MRRRRLVRALALLLLLFVPLLAGGGALVLREPSAYRRIVVPEGPERRQLSGEFSSKVQRLIDTVGTATDDRWSEAFTTDQVNCYFAEDFVRVRPFKLPPGVYEPRVNLQPNQLTLAFRYGNESWNSVITIDLRIWLVANEVNLVGVELLGLHAGAIPVSPQSFLEKIAEKARELNLEVNWYRHKGNPVALVRLQPDRPNPSVLLQRLELQDGKLLVEGRSTEPAPFRSMLSLREGD